MLQPKKKNHVYSFAKRFFDIVLSVFGLILLSPLFLLTAIDIKLEDGGPAVYSQTRTGANGKPFKFYKFRSMCVNAEKQQTYLKVLDESDGPVFKITKDPRITKVGKFLRKTSIDELPQLVNVLEGTMGHRWPASPASPKIFQQGWGV